MQYYLVDTIFSGALRRKIMVKKDSGRWFEWEGRCLILSKPTWREIERWSDENKTLKFKEINMNQVKFYQAIL